MRFFLNFYKIKHISIIVILLVTFSSCYKEGQGGKSTVNGYVLHYGHQIPNAVVYIKFGEAEFPGTDVSTYDASVTADANGYYEFKDLRKGIYYLYGVGFENSIMETVFGGTGLKLKYNKTTALDIPVSE